MGLNFGQLKSTGEGGGCLHTHTHTLQTRLKMKEPKIMWSTLLSETVLVSFRVTPKR